MRVIKTTDEYVWLISLVFLKLSREISTFTLRRSTSIFAIFTSDNTTGIYSNLRPFHTREIFEIPYWVVGDFDTCVGGEVKVGSGGLCLLLLFMRVSCFLAFISRFMVQRMNGSLIKVEDDLRVGLISRY
jgi:hypothetical protein